jgi:hypothetical protein
MAFHVTVSYSNGYRCSCCSQTWDNTEWCDTLEEALTQIPTELVDGQPHSFNGDAEILSIKVVDGATAEKVAWGSVHWSQGYGKYSGYKYTCWSGYRPDTGAFEAVYDGGRQRIGRSWHEVTEELRLGQRVKDLTAAERELAEAQKKVTALQGG